MPTHRLVSGLPGLTCEQLQQSLGSHFQLEKTGIGDAGAREAWEMIEADGGQNLLGFGTRADGIWQVGRLTQPQAMDQLAEQRSPAWRSLGVSILHVLGIDHLLKASPGFTPAPSCKYVHLLGEVTEAMQKGACDLGVLVPPAEMDHVEEIAGNLEKMPSKSTYFYPKLLSGMLFNSLKNS